MFYKHYLQHTKSKSRMLKGARFHTSAQAAQDAAQNIIDREWDGKGKIVYVYRMTRLEVATMKKGHPFYSMTTAEMLKVMGLEQDIQKGDTITIEWGQEAHEQQTGPAIVEHADMPGEWFVIGSDGRHYSGVPVLSSRGDA